MAGCYIGLISGTSMDGIDAAAVDFSQSLPRLLAATTMAFSDGLRAELDRVRADPDCFPTARLAALDATLGDAFAQAALTVMAEAGLHAADVSAIGSHGQTIVHRADATPPYTLQIGDPNRIAARTGIPTVSDFRRADLAEGGQGAPLAPLLHQAMLQSPAETRVVINLGGIANITLLPATGGVSGFDTGPANCYIDFWYRRHHAGQFDENGRWAASGSVDPTLLDRLLDEPYFALEPPKSTGIEHFNPDWLERRLPDWADRRPADVQATLVELSVRTVARAVHQCLRPSGQGSPAHHRVILLGGGVHNGHLMSRLSQALAPAPVEPGSQHGLDPDFAEAMLFAWLARQRMAHLPIDCRSVTGARRPTLLGTLTGVASRARSES